MASEVALVRCVVTGFGSFGGVQSNPTEALVRWLSGRAWTASVPESGLEQVLITTEVLRVAARHVDCFFTDLQARLSPHGSPSTAHHVPDTQPTPPGDPATTPCGAAAPGPCAQARNEPNDPAPLGPHEPPGPQPPAPNLAVHAPRAAARTVLLHLGVASTAREFRLEARAANCAAFRIPDEDAWQPEHQPIDPAFPGGTSAWVGTSLPLARLAERLSWRGAEGGGGEGVGGEGSGGEGGGGGGGGGDGGVGLAERCVVVSEDAGRFLCNWCYFRACQLAEALGPGCDALFVHVPPFEVYGEEAQRAFLLDLVREVVGCVGGAGEGGDEGVVAGGRGARPAVLRGVELEGGAKPAAAAEGGADGYSLV
ncbi:hypothetical protein HYH03_000009 [Edaphochlamys debaryana]|uniref:Uncharacterized protein n=1 Tax=Edaphochlamys debaryana TaxID=47281 RepID=A0A835YIE3_9CHLO|nr:hypothetical protein HYH03_000009 [Edaphochlamys debaryana]|eukprot:KAG2501501.1 hypothetical protein HYH03_000009 [Edaphochlamys debaryana]